jgi:hypothetical protein
MERTLVRSLWTATYRYLPLHSGQEAPSHPPDGWGPFFLPEEGRSLLVLRDG